MSVTRLLLALSILATGPFRLSAQPAIGQWRDHLSYRKTVAVVEGNGRIYCATQAAVFSFDPQDNSTARFTKVNALSDIDISTLAWNTAKGALLVGYANGNLDILIGGRTVNASDIRRSAFFGDKGIYDITSDGPIVYLSCGFGIVVYDLDRLEVKDTWLIGPNAAQLKVNGLAFYQDSIHAATDAGVYSASRNAPNLAAFTSWHKRTDIPRPDGAYNTITTFSGRLLVNLHVSDAEYRDTVYLWNGAWSRLADAYGNNNRYFRVSPNGQVLTLTHRGDVRQYNTDLQQVLFVANVGGSSLNAMQAISRTEGGIWVATEQRGLMRYAGPDDYAAVLLNGPKNNSVRSMSCGGGALYVATGAVAGNWGNQFIKDGVHYFINNTWGTLDRESDPLFNTGANAFGGTVNDVMVTAVDPEDPLHAYIGTWDDGVVEVRNQHVTGFFMQNNSSLQGQDNGTGSDIPVRVAGLTFDVDQNLWITNSNCPAPISVRTKAGSWRSFSPGGVLNNNALLSDIIVGQNGYKWMIRPRSSGMLVFSDAGTIGDSGDDQYKVLNTFEGQGKLPSMDVFSLAEDLEQQIWVGTGKGVAVFYNPDAVFSEDADAQQILIEQDGNVQILLETEAVSAIAVDGANRKWLGTQTSGVYLVSPDGTEQLAHFTAANSPLPSDNITTIAIDGLSGEVFFGTDRGIMSYRGNATEGLLEADCATVFPNPLHQGSTSPVAITGLVRDSDVRITDMAGNLVYRTISLGGQAIWPATDMEGHRVSTGVYLVFATDPTGEFTCNTKVAVVR